MLTRTNKFLRHFGDLDIEKRLNCENHGFNRSHRLRKRRTTTSIQEPRQTAPSQRRYLSPLDLVGEQVKVYTKYYDNDNWSASPCLGKIQPVIFERCGSFSKMQKSSSFM